MNQVLAPLIQYIRLKHGGNHSEFAREFGISPKNMSRMLNGSHFVDMRDGTLYIRARNQRGVK